MEVKGTAVATLPAFIEARFGNDGRDRWLDALNDDARRAFTKFINPAQWYPIHEMFVVPTAAMCDLFFAGQEGGAREVGRFSADVGLKGVYRFFVRLGSTQFIVEKASIILPTYYRPSAMMIAAKEKGRVVARITEFPESHLLVEERIMGWIERAMEISGARSCRVSAAKSMARGADFTELLITWS